jgi:hypothetical protein
MPPNWFESLTGFTEDPTAVRQHLEVVGDQLRSKVNGRSYGIGQLEVLSLAELRARVAALFAASGAATGATAPGPITLSVVQGDVRAMHRDPVYANALFQVASQFNLLEMTSPRVTPEDGVTRYQSDPTQGPACAIAAGAATIYRNYFVPIGGEVGQTARRQIDCLHDLGEALGNVDGRLWRMENGYAMCRRSGLAEITERLRGPDEVKRDELRALVRIGLHWNVQVTDGETERPSHISQAFCSALPVAYGIHPAPEWEAFARLVLEASYEATLHAGVLNAAARGSNVVLLTRVGGGAFGNDVAWIQDAMVRALRLAAGSGLDVRVVSYGAPDEGHQELVDAFRVS